MTYPSVKDLNISERRREHIIKNILSSFEYYALSRRIVRTNYEDLENGFSHLGLNLIVDKIWFVDLTEGEMAYAFRDIGREEGKAIALSETEMVIKSILDKGKIEENLVHYSDELNEESLESAISLLIQRTTRCGAILTNIEDVKLFWLNFESFKGRMPSDRSFGLEGYYKGIPVFWSTSVPKGLTLAINKDVGELLIKKDITADVLEIDEGEYESILNAISDLSEDKLNEKVRLIADEVVAFKFRDITSVALCARTNSVG